MIIARGCGDSQMLIPLDQKQLADKMPTPDEQIWITQLAVHSKTGIDSKWKSDCQKTQQYSTMASTRMKVKRHQTRGFNRIWRWFKQCRILEPKVGHFRCGSGDKFEILLGGNTVLWRRVLDKKKRRSDTDQRPGCRTKNTAVRFTQLFCSGKGKESDRRTFYTIQCLVTPTEISGKSVNGTLI